jgi:antitoxin ParD1/3/4
MDTNIFRTNRKKYMNLSLKPELESFIQQEILTGKYTTPDEVIEAGLKLLDRQNSYHDWATEIGNKIDIANAQIDRGEGLDGDEVFARLRAKFQVEKEAR